MPKLFHDVFDEKINLLPMYSRDPLSRFRAKLHDIIDNPPFLIVCILAIPLIPLNYVYETLFRFVIGIVIDFYSKRGVCPGCQTSCNSSISYKITLIHPFHDITIDCPHCKTLWEKELSRDGKGQWRKISIEEQQMRMLSIQ